MKQELSCVPDEYTVVKLDDKQWYPLQVWREYDMLFPEGRPRLSIVTLDDGEPLSYRYRHNALKHCRYRKEMDGHLECYEWEKLACKSDTYPERCAQYLQIIEEITGAAPEIVRWEWNTRVRVRIPGFVCQRCKGKHETEYECQALVIEDALAAAAEWVYEQDQWCLQSLLSCLPAQEEMPIEVGPYVMRKVKVLTGKGDRFTPAFIRNGIACHVSLRDPSRYGLTHAPSGYEFCPQTAESLSVALHWLDRVAAWQDWDKPIEAVAQQYGGNKKAFVRRCSKLLREARRECKQAQLAVVGQ